MDDPTQTRPASHEQLSEHAQAHERPTLQDRFPFSAKEMIRQIYIVSGAVIVLLSLAIWLMMSLS